MSCLLIIFRCRSTIQGGNDAQNALPWILGTKLRRVHSRLLHHCLEVLLRTPTRRLCRFIPFNAWMYHHLHRSQLTVATRTHPAVYYSIKYDVGQH
jgi:hypothetical protein